MRLGLFVLHGIRRLNRNNPVNGSIHFDVRRPEGVKPSPDGFLVASMAIVLPGFRSRAGQCVVAHEEISGAKGGRTFQQ
jgi:hypothetical protein